MRCSHSNNAILQRLGDLVHAAQVFWRRSGRRGQRSCHWPLRSRRLRCRKFEQRCPSGPKVSSFETFISCVTTRDDGRRKEVGPPAMLLFFACPAGFQRLSNKRVSTCSFHFSEASPLISSGPRSTPFCLQPSPTFIFRRGLQLGGERRHRHPACNIDAVFAPDAGLGRCLRNLQQDRASTARPDAAIVKHE